MKTTKTSARMGTLRPRGAKSWKASSPVAGFLTRAWKDLEERTPSSGTGARELSSLRAGVLLALAAALFLPRLTAPLSAEERLPPPVETADLARGEGGFELRLEGTPPSGLGAAVAAPGDVNGDGLPDLIVTGTPVCPLGKCFSTPAYVVFGRPNSAASDLRGFIDAGGGFAILPERRDTGSLGAAASGVGDLDGDGLSEIALGAPEADPGRVRDAGATYVIFGKPDTAPVELEDVVSGDGGFVIYGAARDGRSGSSLAGIGDLNGDGVPEIAVGAPEAAVEFRNRAGEVYVVFGRGPGTPVDLAEVAEGRGGFAIRGWHVGGLAGAAVASIGDLNGDGMPEILVGAPGASPDGRAGAGEAYVVFGKSSGGAVELRAVAAGDGGFVLRGRESGSGAGAAVASIGDLNGDGLPELLIAAPGSDAPTGARNGELYVVFGKSDAAAVELEDVAAGRGGFLVRGSRGEPASRWSIAAAGDLQGDGLPDFLIGVPRAAAGSTSEAGAVYAIFGKAGTAPVSLADVARGLGGFAVRGAAEGDLAGTSVAALGDLDGDGSPEIAVGAPAVRRSGFRGAGAAYVLFSKDIEGPSALEDAAAGRGGLALFGTVRDNRSEATVAAPGDVNGDGFDDLAIGLPAASPEDRIEAGIVYVVFGRMEPPTGDIDGAVAEGEGFAVIGSLPTGHAGQSIAGAGDLNGDGLADLLIGAPFAYPEGRPLAGAAYVVFGKRDDAPVDLRDVEAGRGGYVIRGGGTIQHAGNSVAAAGDVNGDGAGDVIVGAPQTTIGDRVVGGAAYVVFGKNDTLPVELEEVALGRGGFEIRSARREDEAGWSVAGLGDVNGDGLGDVAVSAPNALHRALPQSSTTGETYVVFGKRDTEPVDLADVISGRGGFVVYRRRGIETAGFSLAGPGDTDGDGRPDLAIGSPLRVEHQADYPGKVYVVLGKAETEPVEVEALHIGRGGYVVNGSREYPTAGWSVAPAGDVNEDGLADLVVGAPGGRREKFPQAGAAYVVFGKRDDSNVDLANVPAGIGGLMIRGSAPSDRAGWNVAGPGDVNGDGFLDIAVSTRKLGSARYPFLSSAVYVALGTAEWKRSLPRFRRGAVRGGRFVTITDAIQILNYLFLDGDELPCRDAADADDSGILNVTDAVRILRYLVLGGEPPALPGPAACGEDPNPDALDCAEPPPDCGG